MSNDFERALRLHQSGFLREAVDLYSRILRRNKTDAGLLYLLGTANLQLGNAALALEQIERSLLFQPKNPHALNNLGSLRQGLKNPEEALRCYDAALALDPQFAEAHNNRGAVLQDLARWEEALASFSRALSIRPGFAEAHNGRGNALQALGRMEEALASYERALQCRRGYAEAHHNRGVVLQAMNRPHEALVAHDEALAARPDYAEAHFDRGNALRDLRRMDEAQASYDRALAIRPDYVDATWNKALVLLAQGVYGEGWALYESRLRRHGFGGRHQVFPQSAWRGETDIRGRRLFLYAEQGLGDTIHFCRYIPRLRERGAEIILEVPSVLASLIASLACPLTIVSKGGALPEFDAYCPLMSLPYALRTGLDSIPADIPYLFAAPEKLARWRERLGNGVQPKVGLVWAGSATNPNDRRRSIALKALMPLVERHPFAWHCLQKEFRPDDLEGLGECPAIRRHDDELDDFSETAALITCLDLVISVDTSVAHLAGALGKPVWILLPYTPDYRWMLDRSDSPWYPSSRLYRQLALDDWSGALEAVDKDLDALPDGSPSGSPRTCSSPAPAHAADMNPAGTELTPRT